MNMKDDYKVWRSVLRARRIFNFRGKVMVMNDRVAGLFSIIFQVMGGFTVCERNRHNLVLEFDESVYNYNAGGERINWWSRLFEESCYFFNNSDGPKYRITPDEAKALSNIGFRLPRCIGNRIWRKLKLKREVTGLADSLWSKMSNTDHMIGVHYRGTDKVRGSKKEADPVCYYNVVEAVKQNMKGNTNIFIATDEIDFLDHMGNIFGERVVHTEAKRSYDNRPIHLTRDQGNGGELALDAMLDALLLAKCDLMIRTSSNLSRASMFMNPRMRTMTLRG